MESKELKKKSGIVKRITREYHSYEDEVKKQRERINKLKEAGEDSHKIKKQEEVLAESLSMLPNAKNRLQDAAQDLAQYIEQNKEEYEGTEELEEANNFLTLANEVLNKNDQTFQIQNFIV